MNGIFINYRVGSTGSIAYLLYELLAEEFGEDEVIFASATIVSGTSFDQALLELVRTCDVLLAVIGPDWAKVSGPDRRPRLEAENDWVRREIAEALIRPIPVIPVLVDGALVPSADALPPDLRDLAVRQYVRIGHRAGDTDISGLISAIRRAVPRFASPQPPQDPGPPDTAAPGPAAGTAATGQASAHGRNATSIGVQQGDSQELTYKDNSITVDRGGTFIGGNSS